MGRGSRTHESARQAESHGGPTDEPQREQQQIFERDYGAQRRSSVWPVGGCGFRAPVVAADARRQRWHPTALAFCDPWLTGRIHAMDHGAFREIAQMQVP
jgi:hypothetical protein